MKNEWAQAQKDAAHLGNFLQSLARAGEVFTHVAEAEVELVRLEEKIAEAEDRRSEVLFRADAAEFASQHRVTVAKEAAQATEQFLVVSRTEVAHKRKALEEEAERDRLAFVEFKAKLAQETEKVSQGHQACLDRMATAEEVARASLEAVNRQREKMIADLQNEETHDATPA